MKFVELTDDLWRFIKPLLSPRAKTGRPRADDRMVLNGILYVLTTGCRWMDMPAKYGSHVTAWRRLKRWQEERVWARILEALMAKGYSRGKLSLEGVAVDSTTLKARKRGEIIGYDGYKKVKGTKVHAVVTPQSLPLSVEIGPGNEHESKRLISLIEDVKVRHGRGRPRTRPDEATGDQAYDTEHIRAYLRGRGIKANIPVNPRNRQKPKRGRPYRLNMKPYKHMRSSVERFFAWLKGGFRRLALRWERLASTFLGFIQVACIMIYWRVLK